MPEAQQVVPLDDGTVTTSVMLAIIQALILLGMQAVAEQLVAEVNALAGRAMLVMTCSSPPCDGACSMAGVGLRHVV